MIFDKAWKVVASVAAAAAVIGGFVWWLGREPKREMTPLMYSIARDVTAEFAHEVPRVRDVNTALFLVAGRGPRDEEEQFRRMLTGAVEGTSKYRLETWEDITGKLDKTLVGRFLQEAGLTPGEAPHDLDRAIKAVTRLENAGIAVDGILFVDVVDFTEGPDDDGLGAKITLEGQLYSLPEKKVVEKPTRVTEAIDSSLDPRYVSYKIGQQSFIARLLLWFILSAGLPWAAIGLVRVVLKKRKNELNAVVLVVFTLCDLALFWVLVLALGTSGTSIVGLLLTAGLMGYYNYDALDYIGRRLL
jgi:hypothetical protein